MWTEGAGHDLSPEIILLPDEPLQQPPRLRPGEASAPLVLLHGSGGDEHYLVSLAEELAPGSPILGLRGIVAIDGGLAFFHRFRDRTIDEADITARTPVLANYIETTLAGHSVTRTPIAIGFSNGAIMVAALLLTRPSLLAGAIPFRPLSPFGHDMLTRLDGTPILVVDGRMDSRRSPGDGFRLAGQHLPTRKQGHQHGTREVPVRNDTTRLVRSPLPENGRDGLGG